MFKEIITITIEITIEITITIETLEDGVKYVQS